MLRTVRQHIIYVKSHLREPLWCATPLKPSVLIPPTPATCSLDVAARRLRQPPQHGPSAGWPRDGGAP